MKIIDSLILGLLLAPGLYATEYTESDAKRASAAIHADADLTALLTDKEREELGRLAEQTPEQTAQANTLHKAIQFQEIETVRTLLASKVDVNARSSANNNVLRLAFNPEIMQLLLDHKAHVNGIEESRRTSLHWQCLKFKTNIEKNSTIACIRKLLEYKADVNTKDMFGRTPFCLLQTSDYMGKPNPDFIAEFLEYGADSNTIDHKKLTILDELRKTLESDDYVTKQENRVPTCKIICILDNHRKRIDTIDDALVKFPRPLISIVASYDCGNRPADKAKLDALLHDFQWLFYELERKGELSKPLITADHFSF